jgi:serine O-acetyltransferase
MCKRRIPILPEVIRAISVCLTGAEICPQAQIGPGFVIKHPAGIVVGHGVVMGSACTLLQNVTIGEKLDDTDYHSYPVIGDNVIVCAGAVIVGNITIGTDATIGANAVVLSNIPAGATAVGVPAQVVSIKRDLQA